MEELKRVVIKQELVELTGDFRKALILNQFIYWSKRVKDSDKWLAEEKDRARVGGVEIDIVASKGWIYKNADELNDELMMSLNVKTLRKLLNELIEVGYINSRRNPKYAWDKTLQYRVDLVKVQSELMKIGYSLDGYPLLPIENKNAPTSPKVEGKEKSNSNNSICNEDNNNTSANKNKEEKNVKEITEVEKAIKESNVNIKKADLKECNEIFKDMDRLVKALKQMESTNSHGIKALKLAYIKAEASKSGNYQQKVDVINNFDKPKKKFLTDNSMKVDDKRIDEYEPNDFNRMVEERQTWRSQPVVETNKFK